MDNWPMWPGVMDNWPMWPGAMCAAGGTSGSVVFGFSLGRSGYGGYSDGSGIYVEIKGNANLKRVTTASAQQGSASDTKPSATWDNSGTVGPRATPGQYVTTASAQQGSTSDTPSTTWDNNGETGPTATSKGVCSEQVPTEPRTTMGGGSEETAGRRMDGEDTDSEIDDEHAHGLHQYTSDLNEQTRAKGRSTPRGVADRGPGPDEVAWGRLAISYPEEDEGELRRQELRRQELLRQEQEQRVGESTARMAMDNGAQPPAVQERQQRIDDGVVDYTKPNYTSFARFGAFEFGPDGELTEWMVRGDGAQPPGPEEQQRRQEPRRQKQQQRVEEQRRQGQQQRCQQRRQEELGTLGNDARSVSSNSAARSKTRAARDTTRAGVARGAARGAGPTAASRQGRVCYGCRKPGHEARDCRWLGQRMPQVRNDGDRGPRVRQRDTTTQRVKPEGQEVELKAVHGDTPATAADPHAGFAAFHKERRDKAQSLEVQRAEAEDASGELMCAGAEETEEAKRRLQARLAEQQRREQLRELGDISLVDQARIESYKPGTMEYLRHLLEAAKRETRRPAGIWRR